MGEVILFPLTPKTPDALTFWHVAGDIIWRGQPISLWQAHRLREGYASEARSCWAERDIKAAGRSAKLWRELTNALDAFCDWSRVVGRRVPEDIAGALFTQALENTL